MTQHTFEEELPDILPGLEIDKLPLTMPQRVALGRYRRATLNYIPVVFLCIDLPSSVKADAYIVMNNYLGRSKKTDICPEDIGVNIRGDYKFSEIRDFVLEEISKVRNSWIVVYSTASHTVGHCFLTEEEASTFSTQIFEKHMHSTVFAKRGVSVYAPGAETPHSRVILSPQNIIVETHPKDGE